MEEKKYPIIEEEDGYGCIKAEEPMEAVSYMEKTSSNVKEFEDMPKFGPSTSEQAVRMLRKAEHQFATGQWMTGEEFFSKTRKMIDQYVS